MFTMMTLAILAGLVTGILINLCADALSAETLSGERPARFSFGAPACAACGRRRPPLAWSALLAHLTGRHRCSSCGTPLSLRHAVVELASIVLFVLVWTPLTAHAQTNATMTRAFNTLYGAILALVLVIDLEHRVVPHVVMLPAIGLAALAAFLNPAWDSPLRALLGGTIGLLCALALYGGGILFVRLLGRIQSSGVEPASIDGPAFGFGDVTLITFIGLIVGAPQILFALAIGLFSGGLFALVYLLLRGLLQKRYTLFTAIPYAPFLVLGGTAMLFFGQEIMAWYR